MTTKTQNKKAIGTRTTLWVPVLRFPEFSGEWEEKRLGEVSRFFSGGTPASANRKYYSGNIPFIKSGEISKSKTEQFITEEAIKESSAKIVESGDLLYALYGATSGTVAISKINGAINQAVLCIRTDQDKNWLFNYLDKNKGRILAKYLQGGQGNLSADIVKNLKITFPLLPEQQKIAGALGAVDEKIEGLAKKKKSLEQYKKGVMQKIFAGGLPADRQVRFKDEDGNSYPDWEEKKLSEIGTAYNGLSGKSGEDFGGGDPFITYKQIFDNSSINVQKFALVKVGEDEKQNRAQFGDAFFTTSSETPLEVGFASMLLDKGISPYLNSFSFGFRPNSLEELDPYFAKFFFRSSSFRRDVVRLAQGSTRYNISKIAFMKIKLLVPSLSEQQKIAEFLTSLDEKISAIGNELSHAKEFKKGLLQQMFV